MRNYNSLKPISITLTVSPDELRAIDNYLKPLFGKRGPFIRQTVLDKIGYKPKEEADGRDNGGKAPVN